MIYLPDTNACIQLLRNRSSGLAARWRATKAGEIVMCSVVVYELRYGAERCSDPAREHANLDVFLAPLISLPFDDACAGICAQLRRGLEYSGAPIGPHDLQIASIALRHGLTLVTHNTKEFVRISNLKIEDWQE